MSFNFGLIANNQPISSSTTNYFIPSDEQLANGITLGSGLLSQVPNAFFYALSSQIDYIQQNGGFWIPQKQYSIGSIVSTPVVVGGITKIYNLQCVANSSGKDYCIEPPFTNSYNVNETGSLYFQGNTINSTYWVGVANESKNIYSTSIPDFNVSYPTTQDSQAKNIQLVDLNLYKTNIYNNCNFVLSISRRNFRVDALIRLTSYCVSNAIQNVTLEVLDVQTTLPASLAFNSSSSIFNANSRFKDVALLGCILSINQDNTISLNVLGMGGSASGNVTISTYILENSNIVPLPVMKSRSYTFMGNMSNTLIPLCKGATNQFLGVGKIFSYFGSLSFTNMFKNRLILLNTEKTVDSWLYKGIQANQGNSTLLSVQDRYLVSSSQNSNYISQKLPNITGTFRSHGETNGNIGGGSWDAFGDRGATGCFGNYGVVNSGSQADVKINFNANSSNAIYQNGANVTPNSTKIYQYMQGF